MSTPESRSDYSQKKSRSDEPVEASRRCRCCHAGYADCGYRARDRTHSHRRSSLADRQLLERRAGIRGEHQSHVRAGHEDRAPALALDDSAGRGGGSLTQIGIGKRTGRCLPAQRGLAIWLPGYCASLRFYVTPCLPVTSTAMVPNPG